MIQSCPYCELDTGGNHEQDCPSRQSTTLVWICPFCNVVYPYWVGSCECSKRELYTTATKTNIDWYTIEE